MAAKSNKTLVRGSIRVEPHELLFERGKLSLRTGGPSGTVRPIPAPAKTGSEDWGLSADGQSLRIPWRLVAAAADSAKSDAPDATRRIRFPRPGRCRSRCHCRRRNAGDFAEDASSLE